MVQLQNGRLIYSAKSVRIFICTLLLSILYTIFFVIFALDYPLLFFPSFTALVLIVLLLLKSLPAKYSINIFDWQDIEFIKSDKFLSSCLERTLCNNGQSFRKEFVKNISDYLNETNTKLQKLEEERASLLSSI